MSIFKNFFKSIHRSKSPDKSSKEIDVREEYRNALIKFYKTQRELSLISNELCHHFFITKDKFDEAYTSEENPKEIVERALTYINYPKRDKRLELRENEDYEIVRFGYDCLAIFYGKQQPLNCLANDNDDRIYYHPVETYKIIKKFRQQRTQGDISGRSFIDFKSSSGIFHHSVQEHGEGSLNGKLDTLDEFILVINYNGKNGEVRVSPHLYYMVEEGDEMFMTLNKFYPSDLSAEWYPYRKYNFTDSISSEKRKQYKKHLEEECEQTQKILIKYQDLLPYEKLHQIEEELRFCNW